MKAYHNFTDAYGNEYKFDNYMDFAKFWFNMKRRTAVELFHKNFDVLQKAAANSKEARTRIVY